MTANWQSFLWKLRVAVPILTGCLAASISTRTVAQITPDATLGNEASQVKPINEKVDRIDGGAVRGSNLFHSFQDFNVGEGRGAYFANPAGVENILSRVTGNNPSNIFGTLGVLGNANLFLLNPNGIIFGQNAKLDIRGSFIASSAGGVIFNDRTLFSADKSQTTPLLTMAVPVGLQYGTQQAGNISNTGNLAVGQGQKLALVGGTVTSSGQMTAPGGTVHLLGNRIGLLDSARVDVSSESGGGTVLIGGDFQGKGEVPNAVRTFVSPNATINADALSSGNGGRVIVWADEATGFYGNVSARGGSSSGNGGFVEVSGKQNLIFDGKVDLSTPNGNLGKLLLDPENVRIANTVIAGEANTISKTSLQNQASEVVVEATNNITIDNGLSLDFNASGNPIKFFADTDKNGSGFFLMDEGQTIKTNGRPIDISGATLTLGNLDTSSQSSNGGNVTLNATNGKISTGFISTAPTNSSQVADVKITSNNGSISINNFNNNIDKHSILARSINIQAPDIVSIVGFLNARTDSNGNAGEVIIGDRNSLMPSSITLAGISTRNLGGGNGGKIIINTTGTFEAKGAFLGSTGKPVDINTPSALSLATQGTVNGGEININADGGITIEAGINSNNCFSGENCASSAGGNITLKSNGNIKTGFISTAPTNSSQVADVKITSNNGFININNFNNNTDKDSIFARSINIEAPGIVSIIGFLNARTDNNGNAGEVIIGNRNSLTPSSITLAGISARNLGRRGNGGKIIINTTGTFEAKGAFSESTGLPVDINIPSALSLATQGSDNGGEININADGGIIAEAGINSNNCFFGDSCNLNAGGDITLRSFGNIRTAYISAAANNISKFATVNITSLNGSVRINGFKNEISENSVFAKKITINTPGTLFIVGDLNARSDGLGNTASISIGENELKPSSINVGVISTRNLNNGNGGDGGKITIETTGLLSVNIADTRSGNNIIPPTPINDGFSIGSEADRNGGEINIIAKGGINTVGGIVSNSRGSGKGGDITINGGNGVINIAAGTVDSSSLSGNAGKIEFNAAGDITAGNILSYSGLLGKAGNVNLTSSNGIINTSAGIINASSGTGSAGDVKLTARENILSGSIESVGTQGGNITLNSGGKISLNQADIASITVGKGKGSDIRLSANKIELTDARVATVKVGEGRGGDLFVNASDSLGIKNNGNSSPNGMGSYFFEAFKGSLRGSGLANTTLTSPEGGRADSGNIEITTRGLSIENQQNPKLELKNSLTLTGIGTLPLGDGNAGNITVNASDFVKITGNDSTPYNTALSDDANATKIADEKAADIQGIRTGITSAIIGKGNAGEIKINTGRFEVKNTAAITSGVTLQGTGKGNNITVDANSLELQGKAALATASRGESNENVNVGNLNIDANKITLLDGALLSADTFGAANGGNLNINTNELYIRSGSRIGATSFSSGEGGTVKINSPERKAQIVSIDGTLSNGQLPVSNQDGRSGIFTESRATGRAGNIELFTNRLDVENRGEISVSSFSTGQAGNLNITADSIFLNRQARLNSSARFGTGGNINFNVTGDIVLSNNGDKENATEISSTAFNDAQGGNIIFNVSPKSFIRGNRYENSDVVATAERTGKGGLIDANSAKLRIFSFRQFNGQRTEESDFTADSALGLDGIVRGTQAALQAQLPQQPVVRDIPQVCASSQGITTRQAGRSAYSNTGRGGLPPNPSDALDSNIPQVPWVTLDSNQENPTATNTTPSTTSKPEIEEAEGWVRQPNGKLTLTTRKSIAFSPCIYQSSQQ